MSQRRQYSSCDSCRRSKRRCFFSGPSEGDLCTNCRRLGHACTFEFAKSRRATRGRLRRSRSHSHLSINRNALPEFPGDGLSNGSKSQIEAGPPTFPDTLVPWLNFDEGHSNEVNSHDDVGLDLMDLLMSDTVPPAQALSEAQLSFYNRGGSPTPILPGTSLSSPIRLLNSKLDATILDDRLVRIHNVIITGCVSRFADYNCNLFATASRYRIEGWDGASTQDRSPQSEVGVTPTGVPCTLTAIGAVRFLDHFGGLYGNQLSPTARKQSDAALKAVLRTFSLQWLSTSEGTPAPDSTRDASRDASRNAFYDSWFEAREILRDVQSVRSFRIVYAILLFEGIATPTQASAGSPHEFLDIGLQTLRLLDALVKKYCTILGVHSTYGMLLEASMSLVRWGGYIRDIGASLTTYRQCALPPVSCHGKGKLAPLKSKD